MTSQSIVSGNGTYVWHTRGLEIESVLLKNETERYYLHQYIKYIRNGYTKIYHYQMLDAMDLKS